MKTALPAADADRWDEFERTAATVRAGAEIRLQAPRSWRRLATTAAYLAILTGVTVAALHAATTAMPVHADGSADADLFSLTNQDRASNGVRSLSFSGTLQTIGEGGRYNGCGFAVNGRSVDMIQRNYFSHVIRNCGQNVFAMMQAYGVHYLSAGENIGWNTVGGAAAAASSINLAFMNSPEHRSNILDAAYTSYGVGSANSGAAAWSGGGGSYTGVWMFSEEFAQLRSSPPPPPPPPPPPRPRPRPTAPPAPTRNRAAPAPPAQPPARAAAALTPPPAPAATATPTPSLTATPGPTPLPVLTVPPLQEQTGGLLFNSVESVLESYFID